MGENMALFGKKNQNPEEKAALDKINDYIGKITCKEEPLAIISAFTKQNYLWAEARKRMVEETYAGMLSADKVEDRYCELVSEITGVPADRVFKRRADLRGESFDEENFTDSAFSESSSTGNDKIYVMNGNIVSQGTSFTGNPKDEIIRCKCILDDDNLLIDKKSLFSSKSKGMVKVYYNEIQSIEFVPGPINSIQIVTQYGETLIQHMSKDTLTAFYNGLMEYYEDSKDDAEV